MIKLTSKQKALILFFVGSECAGAILGFLALRSVWSPLPMAATALLFASIWSFVEAFAIINSMPQK